MAVSEDYLVSLVRLQASHEFQTVINQMKSDLDKADKDNRRLSGEPLYRSQGRAIYIEEFLSRLESARSTVEKMRAENRTP